MNESDMIAGSLVAIEYIARNYGARMEVSDEMQEECQTLIEQQFSDFSITEIVQAYRLWAAGKIEALEMYGGQFNVTQMGRVLSSYREFRYEINQAIAREKNQDEAAAAEAARKEELRETHRQRIADFPQTVADTIADGRYGLPQQVPVYWYEFAEAHDMIKLKPGEKLAFAVQAEKQIEAERARQLKDSRNLFITRSLQSHHDSTGTAPIWNRAKQLILWVKVLNRSPIAAKPEQTTT